jgi:hypothetical protein
MLKIGLQRIKRMKLAHREITRKGFTSEETKNTEIKLGKERLTNACIYDHERLCELGLF